MPSGYTKLHSEKMVKRPGELSAGEYKMLIDMILMYLIQRSLTNPVAKKKADRWYLLVIIQKQVNSRV